MRGITLAKMLGAGVVCCVGGPALVMWVQPDPDELFKKYNPELQKKSLEGREQRLKDHEEFIARLKAYSKDDRPVWVVAEEESKRQRQLLIDNKKREREELERQKQQILEEQKKM
ncbi:uncharacterized protein H6S33_005777 [Morchella sextelata]|uniref:uncharacterized protein n=1 Tax=Morchella sextelata TaxID=1174677 RepID=UPI001D0534C5|nr:uncharacterized protein H6S33_005777 [Morchella sextelata]KAH0613891.1 hypothetical protein H6S33_005777 [Morchella sextelata]